MSTQIKFTIGSVAQGYKTIEITLTGDNATYKILRSGLLDVDKKISRDVKLSADWLETFDALEIFSWDKNFSASGSGEQWTLAVDDGENFYRGHGKDAYPAAWTTFLDLLDIIAPEMEFVSRGRLEKITMNYFREMSNGYTLREDLTLDRAAETLTLTNKNTDIAATHIYNIAPLKEKLFTAAQIFFDGVEKIDDEILSIASAKFELLRHDGMTDTFTTPYNEDYLPGLGNFVRELRNVACDLTTDIFAVLPSRAAENRGKYILGKVQFPGSYKHYTYRTDDETLKAGDIVDVPVGKNNDVVQARLVEIGYFAEDETPFPVDRIKKIIGKHVDDY